MIWYRYISRHTPARLLLVLCMFVSPCLVFAAEKEDNQRHLILVTNIDNPVTEVSRRELGRIYLKQTKYWRTGKRCVPIDQPGTSEARKTFYALVLNKDPYEMKRYWMQETMTGNATPPITLDNATTVKRYVQKIEGAVGYIRADELDDSVKVLVVSDVPELNEPESPEDAAESEDER